MRSIHNSPYLPAANFEQKVIHPAISSTQQQTKSEGRDRVTSKEEAKQGFLYRTLGRRGEMVSAIGVGAAAGVRRQDDNSMD